MNAGFSYFHADQRGSWHTCLKRLDKVEEMAIIRGVLGWSNQQEAAISTRAKQVGLLPTAYSNTEEKHRTLKGGAVPGRLGRLPENFKGAVVGPLLFCAEMAEGHPCDHSVELVHIT